MENIKYMNVKGMLNACYGVCVSRLNTTEIAKKQFLSPYRYIYVTAYCRKRILSDFEKVGKNALYADTDGIKVLGTFDNECTYKRFKTYGAKRYIYTKYDFFVNGML